MEEEEEKPPNLEENFPKGLRVLVVDDDEACLETMSTMLQECEYQVTTASSASDALSILREKDRVFDIVMSDVLMPGTDGMELLKQIRQEMDLPVVVMSDEENTSVAVKGILHGACDYLVKPIRKEVIKNIWQHVLRKRSASRNQKKETDDESETVNSAAVTDESGDSRKRRSEDEVVKNDCGYTGKKQRVVWAPELHDKFLKAVNELGDDKAVPKKILELMDDPKITRENVASHLQKYRDHKKRTKEHSQRQHRQGMFVTPRHGNMHPPRFPNVQVGVSDQVPCAAREALGVNGGSYMNRSVQSFISGGIGVPTESVYGNQNYIPIAMFSSVLHDSADIHGPMASRMFQSDRNLSVEAAMNSSGHIGYLHQPGGMNVNVVHQHVNVNAYPPSVMDQPGLPSAQVKLFAKQSYNNVDSNNVMLKNLHSNLKVGENNVVGILGEEEQMSEYQYIVDDNSPDLFQ